MTSRPYPFSRRIDDSGNTPPGADDTTPTAMDKIGDLIEYSHLEVVSREVSKESPYRVRLEDGSVVEAFIQYLFEDETWHAVRQEFIPTLDFRINWTGYREDDAVTDDVFDLWHVDAPEKVIQFRVVDGSYTFLSQVHIRARASDSIMLLGDLRHTG